MVKSTMTETCSAVSRSRNEVEQRTPICSLLKPRKAINTRRRRSSVATRDTTRHSGTWICLVGKSDESYYWRRSPPHYTVCRAQGLWNRPASVCLSVSLRRRGFAAVRAPGGQVMSINCREAGAQQQTRAVSRSQPTYEAKHRHVWWMTCGYDERGAWGKRVRMNNKVKTSAPACVKHTDSEWSLRFVFPSVVSMLRHCSEYWNILIRHC